MIGTSSGPDYDFFISYARRDQDLVFPLLEALEDVGCTFWVDDRELQPGELWIDVIDAAVRRSAAMVVFCSSQKINDSTEVPDEIDSAVREGKRIVPVFLADVALSGEVRKQIRRLHRIELWQDPPAEWGEILARKLMPIVARTDRTTESSAEGRVDPAQIGQSEPPPVDPIGNPVARISLSGPVGGLVVDEEPLVLAGEGPWVVLREAIGGSVRTRHRLTEDVMSLVLTDEGRGVVAFTRTALWTATIDSAGRLSWHALGPLPAGSSTLVAARLRGDRWYLMARSSDGQVVHTDVDASSGHAHPSSEQLRPGDIERATGRVIDDGRPVDLVDGQSPMTAVIDEEGGVARLELTRTSNGERMRRIVVIPPGTTEVYIARPAGGRGDPGYVFTRHRDDLLVWSWAQGRRVACEESS